MYTRCNAVLFFVAIGLFAGCKKSEPLPLPAKPVSSPPPAALSQGSESAARIHWLGKPQIAAVVNVTNFMSIWNLPESARLETQTLDKLATAPWRLLLGEKATNAASALLRPLLDDAVQVESFLEIRDGTHGTGELAFAIRLDKARAALWETNLASVLESLTGIRPTTAAGGWSLKKHHAPNLIELSRVGEWVIVGAGQEHNALFDGMRERIGSAGIPFIAPATNYWIEASVDLKRVAGALSLKWNLPDGLPRISATVIGNGENITTRGELKFNKPLNIEFEPWNIPTNLIAEPLTGFTAIRGVRPWLSSLKWWNNLQIGAPPNQFFVWTLPGIPAQTFIAAPTADASNQVHRIAERLMERVNPPLASGQWGAIEWSAEAGRAAWTRTPFLSPFLQVVATNGSDLIFGGSFNPPENLNSTATGLLQAVLNQKNDIVLYDWETTGPRTDTWLYLTQLFRMIANKSQLPEDSASMAWVKAAKSRLGNCATVVVQSQFNTVSFVRQSSVGFTAAELQWLADWLESPQFPRGLHTFLAPPPPNPTPAREQAQP